MDAFELVVISLFLAIVLFILPIIYRILRRWPSGGAMASFSKMGDEAFWLCPFYSFSTFRMFPLSIHLTLKKANDEFAQISSNKQTIELTTSDRKWLIVHEKLPEYFVGPIVVKDFYTGKIVASCQDDFIKNRGGFDLSLESSRTTFQCLVGFSILKRSVRGRERKQGS